MPAVIHVEDSTVVLNGVRFHYRDWENDGAPQLVVLHALGDCAQDWDAFAEALNEDFRVLVLDQRGHGDTWHAADYGADVWVEDIEAFARTLGLRAMAVVGHGMGARYAWQFAARHRPLVKRLVLIDEPDAALPAREDASPAVRCADFGAPEEALWALANELPWADERTLRRWVMHKFREGGPGRWEVRWDARMRLPGQSARAYDNSADIELRRLITTPTIIVQSADRKGSTAPPAIPGAERIQLIESHHPLLHEPRAAIDAVLDWL